MCTLVNFMTTLTTSTVEETFEKPEKAVVAVGVTVGVTHTQRNVVLGLSTTWELIWECRWMPMDADGVVR
jgi:hypothetical protein